MRAIIDTCIVVDALQSRQPFCVSAQEIFLSAANERFVGCITAKSVTDIYYLTHRLTHSDAETRKILSKLFSLFQVVDTAGTDCTHALPSPVSDYEDAVMIETAKRCEADCIVTRNTEDYKLSSVTVYSPEEFLRVLGTENE